MSIEGRINIDCLFHDNSSSNLSSSLRVASATYSIEITNGSTADEIFLQSLSDDRGNLSLTAVKAIYIRNKSATNTLRVSVDNWTSLDSVLLPFNLVLLAGGVCVYTNPTATGWTTIAGSALSIIAAAEGQSVEYDILLVGEGTA